MNGFSRRTTSAYQTRTPIFWWIRKWTSVRFILRELTSVFVAIYAFMLLFFVRALYVGPEQYADFIVWLKSLFSIALSIISFLFVLFHAITWFNLAPKALIIRVGKWKVPDLMIVASNFLGWALVSSVVVWIILG